MLHLTSISGPEVERAWRETPPGMAHWAASGPPETKCVDCRHLDLAKDSKIEKARCRKYATLMRRPGKKFSKRTAACKFFEAR